MRKTKSEIRGNDEIIRSVAAEVGEFLDGQSGEAVATAPKKTWLRWVAAGTALCLALGVAAFGMIRHRQIELRYVRETAERRDLVRAVSVAGAVRPAEACEITAQVSGTVLEAPFAEGQTVQKDAVLYVLDSTEAQRNLESLKNAHQSAQNTCNSLQKAVANCNIKAPIAGVVTRLYVGVGDRVEAGAQIGTVADRSAAYLNVRFSSQDAAKLAVGQAATVTAANRTHSGVVESIFAVEEAGPGGVPVRQVRIKIANPQGVSEMSAATATVGGAKCIAGANFTFPNDKVITAGASGRIKAVRIKEGNRIEKNAVVATIDRTELQAQLETAKTNLEASRLALENGEKALAAYRITAPIAGTVVTKKLNVGDVLQHETVGPVAMIYDLSRLELTVDVEETKIKEIAVGQNVRITTASLEGKEFVGKVTKVGLNGTAQNGATVYPVTVAVENTPDLLPGMNVSAEIFVMERAGVLAVPIDAVAADGTVLVKKDSESGKAAIEKGEISGFVRVKVECGERNGEFVEIISGLSEGDEIAFDPSEM